MPINPVMRQSVWMACDRSVYMYPVPFPFWRTSWEKDPSNINELRREKMGLRTFANGKASGERMKAIRWLSRTRDSGLGPSLKIYLQYISRYAQSCRCNWAFLLQKDVSECKYWALTSHPHMKAIRWLSRTRDSGFTPSLKKYLQSKESEVNQ